MRLLGDAELERSAAVAHCLKNRERGLAGSNDYDREPGQHPLDSLKGRLAPGTAVTWLDLCCGTGKALIEFPPGSGIKRFENCGECAVHVPFEGREIPIFEEPPELILEMACGSQSLSQ